jgi:exonuclease SbcC
MISILLALNISLYNSKINFLLIDDPIQTLDDLNQLAFINLLRYQFADKQIILSTHEQEFSNFIRYKFWRLGLSQTSFNVKDRFLELKV